jgi:hypothetical protein
MLIVNILPVTQQRIGTEPELKLFVIGQLLPYSAAPHHACQLTVVRSRIEQIHNRARKLTMTTEA